MKSRSRLLVAVALILVLALAAFASLKGLRTSTSSGGREVVGISKHLFSPSHLSGEPSSLTLTLGDHSARVTLDSVSLDDGRTLAIPPACSQVEIRETWAGLVVAFDGSLQP